VALVLIILPLGVVWFVLSSQGTSDTPSSTAVEIANFNPRTLLTDSTPHFLPTPVAALPAETDAGPPAPAADEASAASEPAPAERVKVANTGGVGAILRADPPKGKQVAALRDGTVLDVLEHRRLDDGSEWLRVQTPDGVEGWVFSRLVSAAE
jgi:hypothetical protein